MHYDDCVKPDRRTHFVKIDSRIRVRPMQILATAVALAPLMFARAGGGRLPVQEPGSVEIVGLDYAFRVPTKVMAGRTTFRFVNKGKFAHELNISLLKSGASVDRFMDAVRADKPTGEFRDGAVGVLFASPGQQSGAGLSVDLLPGRTYVVICINRDDPKTKRHYEMGMYTVIVPTPATRAATASALRVDTIVATEYSFRYPETLPPGHHSFAFVNNGKFRHEVVFALLKKGVTLAQALKTQKDGGDVDALVEGDFGLLHTPAETSPLGRLEIDMLPGREYAIICSFANDDKSPPHVALGMFGSIHVSKAGRARPKRH
jgi:hypothetical protein